MDKDLGVSNEVQFGVRALNVKPQNVAIVGPSLGWVNPPLTFTANAQDVDPVRFSWKVSFSFRGQQVLAAQGSVKNFSFTPRTAGYYTLELTANDGGIVLAGKAPI